MVFQDSMTSLNPLLTIGRQITESLAEHLGAVERRRAAARGGAARGGRRAGARARLAQYPHQLSGGLRQRAAVAIALAPNPELLIADEPTTALDVTIQAQLLELLQRERSERGMALILITHDLGVVAGMADRLCVMYAGRIVEEGPTEAVFARAPPPLHARPAAERAADRRAARGRLASIPGVPPPIWDCRRAAPSGRGARSPSIGARRTTRRSSTGSEGRPQPAGPTCGRPCVERRRHERRPPLVEAQDLTVEFRVSARDWRATSQRLRAVDQVSFDIQRGRDAGARRGVRLREDDAGTHAPPPVRAQGRPRPVRRAGSRVVLRRGS